MGTTFNRFDFLRLVFASLVFLYHLVVLSSVAPQSAIEHQLAVLAELSIQGFFIVSGALVYGSWERSRGLGDYAEKRARRLLPAYGLIILIPALFSLILTVGVSGAGQDILNYLSANLIFLNFLNPTLPGLFENQRMVEVNGALWTLKIEVMFYLILPLLAWILAALKNYWWIGIAVFILAAFAWRDAALALDHPLSAQLARQLPGQMMYFAAGMALWRLWDLARAKAGPLVIVGIAALTLAVTVPALDALRVLGLSALIAGIAFVPGPALNAARWGDISYGVYIVHFPVVQAMVMFGVFSALGVAAGFALAVILVFGLSFALWRWVEKPALRRDSHYRQVSTEESDHERVRDHSAGRDAGGHRDPHSEPAGQA